jgi:hypothetical protein
VLPRTPEATTAISVQLGGHDYDEAQAVPGNFFLAAAVVQRPLLATPHATDGHSPVEERNRLGVLSLSVLDHELVVGVIGVDGQRGPTVANEPREPVLACPSLAEDLVAKIDDIVLVAGGTGTNRRRPLAGSRQGRIRNGSPLSPLCATEVCSCLSDLAVVEIPRLGLLSC